MALLEVRNICARYPKASNDVLRDISFSVDAGDFYAVIGPSGAGKSTLTRCINRLVEPRSGTIMFEGQDMTALSSRELRHARRHIGMIFQEFNLVNRMSVMDNVLSGRLGYTGTINSFFKLFSKHDVRRALELLDFMGISDHVNKRADKLSGGQRQRVGIARALMQDPKLLLIDEPTASLDPKRSRKVMKLILDTAQRLRIPVLCNIHDVQLAREFCTKILALQNGVMKFDGSASDLTQDDLDAIYEMHLH